MMIAPGAALRLTKEYWKNAPVDVFGLAKELGLGPIFDKTLPDNVSGKIVRVAPGEWRIHVNARHTLVRQRFTVAHEIGHFIYHRDLLNEGVTDTLAYRAEGTDFPNPLIGAAQERQANNFAANLLIPDFYLRGARAAGINDVEDLAANFKVSVAAMKIKLGLAGGGSEADFAEGDVLDEGLIP